MFVFKVAVPGGGTLGGEIAQTIAAADIPVVVKDVKQEFVDAGKEVEPFLDSVIASVTLIKSEVYGG